MVTATLLQRGRKKLVKIKWLPKKNDNGTTCSFMYLCVITTLYIHSHTSTLSGLLEGVEALEPDFELLGGLPHVVD